MLTRSLVLLAGVYGAAVAACASPAGEVASLNDASPGVVEPADAAACRNGDVATQRRGAPCLCCHSEFGIAGSLDTHSIVARIVVTDSVGDVADVAPNGFKNFFRHFPMKPPLRAVVFGPDGGSVAMSGDAPSGDCNACHFAGGSVAPIHGP